MAERDGRMYTVVCQKWEESERGWGVRPDGYSLHLTNGDLKAFIAAHWAKMPPTAPDEYSRPSGTPYVCAVDAKTYRKIKKSESGIRLGSNDYPGDGGPDGWHQMKK